MNLTYTVLETITKAMSKIGIDAETTEAKNVELAHGQLNLLFQQWGADPDLAVNLLVPATGYANLGDTIELPPEYVAAAVPNLAILLAPDFDQAVPKALEAAALTTLNQVRTVNLRRQTGRIPNNQAINKR